MSPPQSDVKVIGQYKVGSEIGRGSFASVYKGVNVDTRTPVAIKSVVRSLLKNKKLLENLEIEISILKDLKHPHIVKLLDYQQTETHFHLIMEYCSLGDLSFFIRKKDQLIQKHPLVKTMFNKYPSPENSNGLNKILVLNYLKQLSSALEFLRSKNLVHRDIKPQNLLLAPPVFEQEVFEERGFVGLPELPILRIADFGFARFLPNTSLAETLCGSPLYMAPEILNYQKYTAKADLWSVGAVLYEMSVGRPPFRASNHLELFNKIKKSKNRIHFPSAVADSIDPGIKKLICSLLRFEPTERMGFQEFFENDIVNYDLNLLLDGVDKDISLEPSQVNENLFISEYIGNGAIIDNKVDQPEEALEEREEDDTQQQEVDNVADITPRVSKSPSPTTVQHEQTQTHNSTSKATTPVPTVKQISTRDIQPISGQQTTRRSLNTQVPAVKTAPFRLSKLQSSDLVVEKEYVVVEKTAVEVNALADELANAGSGAGAIALPNQYYTTQRRRSSRGSSGGSSNGRRPSFDRRTSISISPTNALSKALGLASTRLFGNQSTTATHSTGSALSNINSSNNSFTNNIILNSTNHIINYNNFKTQGGDDIVSQLESLATKAHVVNLYAEVKFSQLIPSPPSANSYAIEEEDEDPADYLNHLPPEVVKQLADEAVLLYVKTLSLLAKAMNIASEWWHNNSNNPSQRLNEIVQWIRERFNEVLGKAEFVKLKLQEANKKLRETNPDLKDEKIYAERLIYDRALEIAKNTAKSEINGTDLLGCELAYSTSIWMLEALLDQEEGNEKLEETDREMVEKYIESISNRLATLKKKLENAQKI